MNQKILKIITVLMIIATLTMANFVLLCANVVSYAIDEIEAGQKTNHKNVEFMAYFKDENENKITEMNAYTNSSDLKLYFQVSVKQEGYFNGNIILNNSNFKLKTDVTSDVINKIENNTIYLNQISAGESQEIEVGIEILKDAQFDLNFINMQSDISIEGIYRDSTQKDISISANRNVSMKLISPYTSKEDIILSQEIITNKVLNYNGEDKRIVQTQIKSGLNNNLFPVEKTTINVQVPKISDKYPEKVLVNSNDVLVTNGKTLTQGNWNYDTDTGLININIENKEENGKVSWIKNGEDKIIITYIFDKDIEINNEKLSVNSKIELYDLNNTMAEASNEITLNNEEKDKIVATTINQYEESIYKGKLYAGIARDITYKNNIYVNLNKVANEINIQENKQTINESDIISNYKTTKINKQNLESVLGNTGSLSIINAETNAVISKINSNTSEDENGNIVISYPESVQTIIIKIENPENIGKLEVESTKTINSTNKDILKNATNIKLNTNVSYISNSNENKIEGTESNIILNETESSVDLQISRTELSSMTSNDNVEFSILLNTKEEKDELFKNPVLTIELPEKIQDIKINSVISFNETELKIDNYYVEGRTIKIVLVGEQTTYKDLAVEGALIVVNANLTTNPEATNGTEQVILKYTNENAINYKDGANAGSVVRKIKIVSYAGVITTNQVSDYGIDMVNNQGVEGAQLAMSSDMKKTKIEKKIINNHENKISDVKILGMFPTKESVNTNNIDIEVGEISVTGIDANRVKIYYSDNAEADENLENKNNNWSEEIKDSKNVKKYLVIIDQLDLLEQVNLSYEITIPSNLEYNESAEEGYTVYYTNVTAKEQVNVNKIRLATAKGAIIDTTLKGFVATKETDKVKENETIRYSIVISNTGSDEITNINVKAPVPEGTTFFNTDELNNNILNRLSEQENSEIKFVDESKKEVICNIDKLAPGETITKYYEVKVNKGMAGKEISNTVTTQYGETTKTSNEVKMSVEEGKLDLKMFTGEVAEGKIYSGYTNEFILYVTNNTDSDVKNVKAKIVTDDNLECVSLIYADLSAEDVDNITIDKIDAGKTAKIIFTTKTKAFTGSDSKITSVYAISEYDNTNYYSNEVNNEAIPLPNITMNVTSENSGKYVNAGDIIKYNITVKNEGKQNVGAISLYNWFSEKVTFEKVLRNGNEMSNEDYSVSIDREKDDNKRLVIEEENIEPNETIEYQIEVVVNYVMGNKEAIELINETALNIEDSEVANLKVEHILKPDTKGIDNEGNVNENEPDENGEDKTSESDNKISYKVISGIAWIDENENGQKDNNEKAVEGMTVKLLDTKKNKFVKDADENELSAKTSSTGFYSFNKVEKGQYLVIFEYDTTKYGLTTFEKEGISDEFNSNVINKTLNVDGTNKKVATTEVITIDNQNISNVNIGLVSAKTFDLQLDKYISKVTVQNNKTVVNTYNDVTLAKQEIDAKQVNSTKVIVEYTIKVTNKGDVAGYVKKIADYLSVDYKFNSELNKDWYQSGNDVYCTSLANEKIEPGESKEVKLIVIKEMKENNTGLVNNTAEIVDAYNDFGLADVNSTAGNKAKGENDMGSADLIISIRTGQVVMTVALIISTVVILGIAFFVIKEINAKKNLM